MKDFRKLEVWQRSHQYLEKPKADSRQPTATIEQALSFTI
jgi:hypothetical protein